MTTRSPSQIVEVTHHGDYYNRRSIELDGPLTVEAIAKIAKECTYSYDLSTKPAVAERLVTELNAGEEAEHGWTRWKVSFWRDDEPAYDVQGNYGYGHGWEAVTTEPSKEEARATMRVYQENEPGIPFRIRKSED